MVRLAETERLIRPYAQSGIVHSCVKVRAQLLSAARPLLWETEDEDAEQVDAEDPVAMLLRKPWPAPMGGRIKFWRTISRHFDLAGGTFLFLSGPHTDGNGEPLPIEPGELPVAMWPIREDLVEIEFDGPRVKSYSFAATSTKRTTFPTHAVAHLYDPDPDNPLRGLGPMQAAWRTASNLFKAEAFDDALVETGGQMGGIVTPTGESDLDLEQRELLKASLKERTKPRHSGEWWITPLGMKFERAAFSPADMQAEKLRAQGENYVMMIFGVTRPLLGKTEGLNYASAREARRVFYESHGIPHLEFLADEFNAQLMPLIGSDYVLAFDWKSIPAMREDAESVLRRVRSWMEIGRSFREAVALEQAEVDGLEEMEGADDRYVSSTLRPIEIDGERVESGPAEPVNDPDIEPEYQAVRRHSTRAERLESIARVEQRLEPRDRAMTRGIARVFKSFVAEQRARLRAVAEGGTNMVEPWPCFPAAYAAGWSPETRALAAALDMLPKRDWIRMQGISADELEGLLVKADQRWRDQLWGAAEKQLKLTVDEAARALAQELELAGAQIIDAANPAMVRMLAGKELLLKEGPMSVVAEQVRRALISGLADGTGAGTLADRVREALERLEDELEALSDRLGTRAAMIARTETASASNTARTEQMKAAGIAQHEWASAGDEVVRESHQIDGEVVVIGEAFSNGLTHPGMPGAPAAMVINCLPGDQRVAGRILGASKAWYSGSMVEIEAEQGHRLTVTINHPVLTSRGFVRAGALREGDYVLCEPLDLHGRSARWDVQDQHGPPTIEQVFEAIKAQGSSRAFAPARRDFYGDARFFDGQVEVVALPSRTPLVHDPIEVNSNLGLEGEAVILPQPREEFDLVLADLPGAHALVPSTRASAGRPGFVHLSSDRRLVGAKRAPLQRFSRTLPSCAPPVLAQDANDHIARTSLTLRQSEDARSGVELGHDLHVIEAQALRGDGLCLGATADLHPAIRSPSGNGRALHAELASDLQRGFPGRITACRVVSLIVRHFEGAVFDLHAAQGYFASGQSATVITRNCRCTTAAVIPELATKS